MQKIEASTKNTEKGLMSKDLLKKKIKIGSTVCMAGLDGKFRFALVRGFKGKNVRAIPYFMQEDTNIWMAAAAPFVYDPKKLIVVKGKKLPKEVKALIEARLQSDAVDVL